MPWRRKNSHSLKSAIGHHDVHGCFLSTLPDSGMIGRKWLKSMEFTLSDSPGSWEHEEGMGLEGVRLGWGYLKKFLHYRQSYTEDFERFGRATSISNFNLYPERMLHFSAAIEWLLILSVADIHISGNLKPLITNCHVLTRNIKKNSPFFLLKYFFQ